MLAGLLTFLDRSGLVRGVNPVQSDRLGGNLVDVHVVGFSRGSGFLAMPQVKRSIGPGEPVP
jgi:hypothetical protein